MDQPHPFQTRNFILRQALRLAEQHGVRQDAVRARAGIDHRSTLNVSGMLPSGVSMTAIECAADLSGDPAFGLKLGCQIDEKILATIVVFLSHCTSLAQICSEVSNYMHVLYGGLRYWAPEQAQAGVVQFDIEANVNRPLPHFTAAMMVLPVRLFRQFFGSEWSPVRVRFSHAPCAPLANYREAFGCDVEFGADTNAIVISPADWYRPIDIRATRVQQVMDDLLSGTKSSLDGADDDLPARVAEIVRQLLPSGMASVRRVAEHLNMSTRAVQRGLAQHGTTFTDLRRKTISGTAPATNTATTGQKNPP